MELNLSIPLFLCVLSLSLANSSWLGDIPDYSTGHKPTADIDPTGFSTSQEKVIRSDWSINSAAIKPLPEEPGQYAAIYKKSVDVYNEGTVLYQQGKVVEAISNFIQSIEQNPFLSQPWITLSNIFKSVGHPDLSLEYAKQGCKMEPSPQCDGNLANLYIERRVTSKDPMDQSRWLRLAIDHYKKAVDLQKDAGLKLQLAQAFLEAGLYKEALLETKKAARLAPKNDDVYFVTGLCYKHLMLYDQARQAYETSIRLNPSNPQPLRALALLYQYVYFDVTRAIHYHRLALDLAPGDITTLHNLASSYNMGGLLNDAVAMYDQVLEIDPTLKQTFMEMVNLKMRICDWNHREEYMERTKLMVKTELTAGGPSTLASWYATNYPLSANTLRDIAVAFSNSLLPLIHSIPAPFTYPTKKPPDQRLKVAIVTSDLGDTNVGRDIIGWFLHHNPKASKVELFLYGSRASDGTIWRRTVEESAEHFFDISALSNYEIAKKINSEGVHIAINLNGYTKHSKNEMFAMQPAPIQVNMKGYPGTLGAPWIHYIITDKVVSPIEHEGHYTEKLLYMPNSYFLSSYPDIFGHIVNDTYVATFTRTQWGLPEEAFLFCDFNHLTKVDPTVFTAWMNILKRVPGSVMWMLRLPPEAEANLRKEATARGVDANRLVFTELFPLKDHLAIKSLCDLFLDTVVFNGHGTGMDSLWAGVPMLTTMGGTFQSRAAGSYATTIGCPEMIAPSLAQYEETAVEWATDAMAGGTKLAVLRSKLKENRLTSPLFDTQQWLRDWETAMEMMWKVYEEGSPPRHLTVPQEPWEKKILHWINMKVNPKYW